MQDQPQLVWERTSLSGQIKRVCNTTAVRRVYVDVSPCTFVEVIEFFVKVRLTGHPFRQIYSCGVSVEELVCQEKLRTTNENAWRNMNRAATARRDEKKTENLRIQPSRFEDEVNEILTP